MYEVYRYWHELVLKFPKSERYTLGQICNRYLLEILEHVLAAAGVTDRIRKMDHLLIASTKLDALRLLIRLCKDTKCLPNVAYLGLESRLHEVGRMLGGWMKSLA